MGQQGQAPAGTIALPQGGGALRGLGEKFAPDLHTGTGNLTVPLEVPEGRAGSAPRLELTYSTAVGAGLFGLGWTLPVPTVSRRVSHGVPRYDDARDVFVLACAEDLVPAGRVGPHETLYRPRTEGSFARITHRRTAGTDEWVVAAIDGSVATYTPGVVDPDAPGRVFSWCLAETRDAFGNVVRYEYETEPRHTPRLTRISYNEHGDGFLAAVELAYEQRPDPFSGHRAGIEIRTAYRCQSITTATRTDAIRPVRRVELDYREDPYTRASLLVSIAVVGFDDDGAEHRDLPPLEFGYGAFDPAGRTFRPVIGEDLPVGRNHELVGTGRGVPDLVELGATARVWRNVGGRYTQPRALARAPAGVRLGDPGVALLDLDGDARTDLVVTRPGTSGYQPFDPDGGWGEFRAFAAAPGFALNDPEVRLLDLDGDGGADALRAGRGLDCWFHRPGGGWEGPVAARCDDPDGLPRLRFTDPRVHVADLTGDGLSDLAVVHAGHVEYWPNRGCGRFGRRLVMPLRRRLPAGFDPRRVLLGDVDGDGLADLVVPSPNGVLVYLNQGGNSWSEPVTVPGAPVAAGELRIVDLDGAGTGGVLWTRDPDASGRPWMWFLDLAGGRKPRLLESVDNNVGAVTEIRYAPSSRFAIDDDRHPSTRWRTSLPIVVPVVERITVHDALSESTLVTSYRYHQGCWDGAEREFRGFGCVEQLDAQEFAPAEGGPPETYAPPTLLRTWFHVGPLDTLESDWFEPDWSDTYWDGDPGLLGHTQRVDRFLRSLRDTAGRADRRARRDALRALRGSVLRTELYGLDGDRRRDRPYTVTEHAYDLREESASATPGDTRVFAPFLVATRTTEWDRGDDPMTRFTFTGDHDPWGQPRRETVLAMPRRSARRRALPVAMHGDLRPDPDRVLATHTRTAYAECNEDLHVRDRVAQVWTYEPLDPPRVAETAPANVRVVLADQARAAAELAAALTGPDPEVRLIGHVVHHYDGEAFTGLAAGGVGRHGALVRTEQLVLTDELLDVAYGADRPGYLGGAAPPHAGAPNGFGDAVGYRRNATEPGRWYADVLRRGFDTQLAPAGRPRRGLVLATEDPLGNRTRTTITPDRWWLRPAEVRDPARLTTVAVYNERTGRPSRVTDPNGHVTHYRYQALGLLDRVYLEGRDGEDSTPEDTPEHPEIRHVYDLSAFARGGGPVSVRTVRRVQHARAGISDETVESIEYSDGFGRLLQTQTQADVLAFGQRGDDTGLLVLDAGGAPRPGAVAGPVVGDRDPERIAVSGWHTYNGKGRLVARYEPFLDSGWGFRPGEQGSLGRRVRTFYDTRGREVRTVAPDGSETRAVYGEPSDLAVPDEMEPSPWVTTTYDANDLAALSFDPDGRPLAGRAPVEHHATPTTTLRDALGRAICEIMRDGTEPDGRYATVTGYDVRGNVLTVVDPLGRTALTQVHDLLNRPLRTASLDAGVTTLVHDARGTVVERRDGRGCVTLRVHDALNRPSLLLARDRPQDPLTVRERVTYGDGGWPDQLQAERDAARDANQLGRTWRHEDEAGEVVVERYDFGGRVAVRTRRVVRDDALAAGWTADWAAVGARAVLEDGAHRTATTYDALGRMTEVLASVSDADPARTTLGYGRSGALASVHLDGDPVIETIAHDARGNRVLIARGNGLVTRYAYDTDSFRLLRMRTEVADRAGDTWTGRGAPIQDLNYIYDLVGNPTAIEERVPGCGVARSAEGRDRLVRRFRYDPLYRLTEATGRACRGIRTPRPFPDARRCGAYRPPFRGSPPVPNQANGPDETEGYTENFAYDPVGNLLSQRFAGEAPAAVWVRRFGIGGEGPDGWRDATSNRLTSVLQGGHTEQVDHDACGNLQRGALNRTLTWDHAGRLVEARTTAGAGTSLRARYLYGFDGLRVKSWVRRGANEESTVDGALVSRRHWTGGGGGSSVEVSVFDGAHRIATRRTGDKPPDDAGPAFRYLLQDHLGSAAVVVDADGRWMNREEFFAYGESSFGGFARKRYRFAGKERSRETGLTYHGARYHHPGLARWTGPDPRSDDPAASPYVYARSNPVRLVDDDGEAAKDALPAPGANMRENARIGNLREAMWKEYFESRADTSKIIKETKWKDPATLKSAKLGRPGPPSNLATRQLDYVVVSTEGKVTMVEVSSQKAFAGPNKQLQALRDTEAMARGLVVGNKTDGYFKVTERFDAKGTFPILNEVGGNVPGARPFTPDELDFSAKANAPKIAPTVSEPVIEPSHAPRTGDAPGLAGRITGSNAWGAAKFGLGVAGIVMSLTENSPHRWENYYDVPSAELAYFLGSALHALGIGSVPAKPPHMGGDAATYFKGTKLEGMSW